MMTKFRLKNVTGGVARGYTIVLSENLQTLAAAWEAKIVNSCPGWAFLQSEGGIGCSFEVTWDV